MDYGSEGRTGVRENPLSLGTEIWLSYLRA